ncbi:hypothetical protein CRM22_005600 [Opisthorchis felineus]|uniref:Uncharacterized protein n=1 Tax=Opisthorchis felineus TaxID=147828 RepID=A0A4S2LQC9_OPIFE|nr:hypothetical protein CRM22_005600 [Opisthorchis felineus]
MGTVTVSCFGLWRLAIGYRLAVSYLISNCLLMCIQRRPCSGTPHLPNANIYPSLKVCVFWPTHTLPSTQAATVVDCRCPHGLFFYLDQLYPSYRGAEFKRIGLSSCRRRPCSSTYVHINTGYAIYVYVPCYWHHNYSPCFLHDHRIPSYLLPAPIMSLPACTDHGIHPLPRTTIVSNVLSTDPAPSNQSDSVYCFVPSFFFR